MTAQDFETWYNAHLDIPYNKYDGAGLSYEIRYSNGDTYEARYVLKPGYTPSAVFEPSMEDYNFECYINGALVKRNSDWVA